MATCPQCSATMEITTLGSMHDKVYRCAHCLFTRDIPDHYEETEERRSDDGRSIVRKTVIRRDLGGEGAAAGSRTMEAQIDTQVTVHDELLRQVLGQLPGQREGVRLRVVDPSELKDLPEAVAADLRTEDPAPAAGKSPATVWMGVGGAVLVALAFGVKALIGFAGVAAVLWWLLRGSRTR